MTLHSQTEAPASRASAFAWIAGAYLVALVVAAGSLPFAPDPDLIPRTLWADVWATIAIFAFSFAFNNTSFYDAYWSVIPPVLVAYWAFHPQVGADPSTARIALSLGLMTVWAVRLTYNWGRGWTGLDHQDWRYSDFQEKYPAYLYWPLSLFGLHMLPTLQVFLGCIPLYYVTAASSRPLGWLDALAVAVTCMGIYFETVADKQLREFVSGPKKPGETLQTGLWRYSRHPNYFGEISFWWGMALFGLAAAPDAWFWCLAGAVAMTALFAFASLPLMEKRSLERRPGYQQVIDTTSILIPMPPKKPRSNASA